MAPVIAAACALVLSRAALAQPAQPQPAQPAQPQPAQPAPAAAPLVPTGPSGPPGAAAQPGPAPQPAHAPQAPPPAGAAPLSAGAQPMPPGYPQYPGYNPYYYPPPSGGYYYPGYPAAQARPAAPAKTIELRRRNPTMMAGGIAATFAGAAGLVVHTMLLIEGQNRYEIYCSNEFGGQPYQCREEDDDGLLTAGWIVFAGSLAAIGVGIPLWVIGGKRVPVDDRPTTAPAARRPAVKPTVALGLGSARVRLEF